MTSSLEKLGLVCLSLVGFQITRALVFAFYNYVLGPIVKNIDLRGMGQWAVVTDAYDGIGKAYAEVLAKKGIDIILMGRQKDKLIALAAEIEFLYRVQTIVIEADFILENEHAFEEMEAKLSALDVGILINNVGMSSPHPEYFLDLPHRNRIYSQIIRRNILSVINMTLILLPRMVERNRGVIVNVSSTAATIPSPLLTVYGASKAYIEKFSKDLACEYTKHGIIIQCIMPGFVATNKSEIGRPSFITPTPEEYVAQAVHTIGIQQHTTGYFPHSILVGIIHFFRYFSPSCVDWMILRTMENIRCRAIQKYVG